MSLQVGTALRAGVDGLFSRSGLFVVVLFGLVGVVGTVATQTFADAFVEYVANNPELREQAGVTQEMLDGASDSPLAVPGGFGAGAAVFLLSVVLGEAVKLVADRTFVSGRTERLYRPTHRLGRAVAFSLVALVVVVGAFLIASVVYGVLAALLPGIIGAIFVLVGLLVLAVGGVYVLLGVYFFRQEIAVFDAGPVDALAESWELVSGERLSVLVLGVALIVVGFVELLVGSVLGPVLGLVGSLALGALTATYASATAANAYRQLLGAKRPDSEWALTPTGRDQYGDVHEDWR